MEPRLAPRRRPYTGAVLLSRPPEVPSPGLVKLAERVEEMARGLKRAAVPTEDWAGDRLGTALAMFSLAIRSVADSGPRSHAASLSTLFPKDTPKPAEPEPLIWYRAYMDWVTFLTIGDMALLDAAALALERANLPASDDPWRPFMALVDAEAAAGNGGSLVKPARQLDIVLREARNRLVAHRIPAHRGLNQWARIDSSFQPSLVAPENLHEAYRHLVEANRSLRAPSRTVEAPEYGDYAILWERLVLSADQLGQKARAKVRQAVRLYGYDSWPATSIVEAVLKLVEAVLSTSAWSASADGSEDV